MNDANTRRSERAGKMTTGRIDREYKFERKG